MLRGWGNLLRGGGNFPATSQTTILSAHQTREALHHTLTMIGGGGSEKASFQLSSLPAPRLSRILYWE